MSPRLSVASGLKNLGGIETLIFYKKFIYFIIFFFGDILHLRLHHHHKSSTIPGEQVSSNWFFHWFIIVIINNNKRMPQKASEANGNDGFHPPSTATMLPLLPSAFCVCTHVVVDDDDEESWRIIELTCFTAGIVLVAVMMATKMKMTTKKTQKPHKFNIKPNFQCFFFTFIIVAIGWRRGEHSHVIEWPSPHPFEAFFLQKFWLTKTFLCKSFFLGKPLFFIKMKKNHFLTKNYLSAYFINQGIQ